MNDDILIMTAESCDHKFSLYSISFVGIRWQCDKCNRIAPACFQPVESAIS